MPTNPKPTHPYALPEGVELVVFFDGKTLRLKLHDDEALTPLQARDALSSADMLARIFFAAVPGTLQRKTYKRGNTVEIVYKRHEDADWAIV